jgi:aryl-alcohol dehydrogenase-like predicted oxidoreductase
MEKRTIGSLAVSVVGLGCNNFGQRVDSAGTARVVDAALAAGINFFDTADKYGGLRSEEFLGAALGTRRADVIVATKFGLPLGPDMPGGGSPAYVRRAVEASLRRLQTDWIDLYQLHVPDPQTPVAETLGVLADLVREGKVREIGCSKFSAGQLAEAAAAAAPGAPRFLSTQEEYSLLRREAEATLLPECAKQGVRFLPFFPLASGLLTGKYGRDTPAPGGPRFGPDGITRALYSDENLARVHALSDVARDAGMTLLELAVSWLLTHDEVASTIAGAMTPEQVTANAAAYRGRLAPDVLARIDAIVPPAT